MTDKNEKHTFIEAMGASDSEAGNYGILKDISKFGQSKIAIRIMDIIERFILPLSMAIAIISVIPVTLSTYSSKGISALTYSTSVFLIGLFIWFIIKWCINVSKKQALKEQEASQKQESSQEQD